MPTLEEMRKIKISSEEENETEVQDQEENEAEEQIDAIEIEAKTIEKCLEQASEDMEKTIDEIEYEIIQEGKKGFLGIFGNRNFILKLWAKKQITEESLADSEEELFKEDDSPDGKAKLIVKKSGIMLTVTSPQGDGRKISIDEVTLLLAQKNIKDYDRSLIRRTVNEANGESVKIGEWKPKPEWDSKAEVEISQDEMDAKITITKPILSGRILEKEEILSLLENYNIKIGILEDKISQIIDKEVYDVPITIAKGIKPENGNNSFIEFKFKTDHSEIAFEEGEMDRVDYHHQKDSIQNVTQGQILGVKHPATMGKPGRTITNKQIEAKDGEDIDFRAGENTQLSDDGLKIIALKAGQAIFQQGEIRVEEIFTVGKVNLETGHITFLGTVLVKGDVQDGFNVKASGNIEVTGNVGKCMIEAGNDVIIKQGVNGKDEAIIKAGHNVYSKFIENSNVYAENDVVVQENIINSSVDAGARIICNGKRACIIGGISRAAQEIRSKNLSSEAGVETILEAGIDPKSKEKLTQLEEELEESQIALQKLTVNINTLKSQKEKDGELPAAKENILKRALKTRKEYNIQIQELMEDIEDLKNYLGNLDTKGKVSAKNYVYAGCLLRIKDVEFKVRSDFKFVTFVNENGFVKPLPFQELEDIEDKS